MGWNIETYLLFHFILNIGRCIAWKAEWVRLSPPQRISPRRSGLVSVVGAKPPLVFGGYAEDGDSRESYQRYVVNDLWKWEDRQWNKVVTTGDEPAPRLVGTAAVLGPDNTKAYLIGGWNSNAKDPAEMFLNTVHELDLDSMQWRKLPAVLPEGPASRHVCVVLDDTILLHTHRCTDYVWLWNGQEFIKQSTTGPCPSPRGLHAACRVGKNQVVIFGGAAQDGTMSSQVFSLNTDTWTWREIKPINDGPSPRASPCIGALDESHVLIYGGAEAVDGGLYPHGDVWSMNLETCEWTCLVPSDNPSAPPPRNGAALLPQDSGEFLLTGGWAPFVETWDDCHLLKVKPDS